jgi:hypothetical protein
LAGLMSDYPKQVQGVGVIGRGLQNLLVKPARLHQMSGTMVIQRLPEQIVFMLGQGLSINLFDMNRKPVDPAARPPLGGSRTREIMPPGVWLQARFPL